MVLTALWTSHSFSTSSASSLPPRSTSTRSSRSHSFLPPASPGACFRRRSKLTLGYAHLLRNVFDKYRRENGTLGLNELADMFIEISKKITALPATAQVASQQGAYLGKKLSVVARQHLDETALRNGVYDDPDDMLYEPFKYKHSESDSVLCCCCFVILTWVALHSGIDCVRLGSSLKVSLADWAEADLSFILMFASHTATLVSEILVPGSLYADLANAACDPAGNSAVFDFNGFDWAGGLLAMYLWRCVPRLCVDLLQTLS